MDIDEIQNIEIDNLDELDQADLQNLKELGQIAKNAILLLYNLNEDNNESNSNKKGIDSLGEAHESKSKTEIEESIQNVKREMKNAISKIIKMSKIRTQLQKDVIEKQIILLNAQIERQTVLKKKADAEAETAELNLEKARLELEKLKKGI